MVSLWSFILNIDDFASEIVPDGDLPKVINQELMSNPDNFYKMAFEFQQIMMVYESAIKQIETKLDILNKENKVSGRRNPIETVKSRIKSPQSIASKLEKKHLPVTFDSMVENLHDIAGVRVICHELHYKTTTNVPESVRRELFRVAETIAMTDREMEEIAIELQNLD